MEDLADSADRKQPSVDFLSGGKRCNIEDHDGWWVGYGKDESCQIEGGWADWVELAKEILKADEERSA